MKQVINTTHGTCVEIRVVTHSPINEDMTWHSLEIEIRERSDASSSHISKIWTTNIQDLKKMSEAFAKLANAMECQE